MRWELKPLSFTNTCTAVNNMILTAVDEIKALTPPMDWPHILSFTLDVLNRWNSHSYILSCWKLVTKCSKMDLETLVEPPAAVLKSLCQQLPSSVRLRVEEKCSREADSCLWLGNHVLSKSFPQAHSGERPRSFRPQEIHQLYLNY